MSGIPLQRFNHMHHAFSPGVENEEPVAVVRVVADLFMALSLCFMMATTVARSGAPAAVDATPGQSGQGPRNDDPKVTLVGEGKFVVGPGSDGTTMSATQVLAYLHTKAADQSSPTSILVRFRPDLSAVSVHISLLALQKASGDRPITIRSVPASE